MSEEERKGLFPTLLDLLTEDTIIANASFFNWKETIEGAGEVLIKTGAVEPKYISAMIRFKEELFCNPLTLITNNVKTCAIHPSRISSERGFPIPSQIEILLRQV